MDFSYLFEPYDRLVNRADNAFARIAGEHPDCISCKPGCADCCYAVFGLFLIEAVFLKHDFDQLGGEEKKAALERGLSAEKELETLERTLSKFKDDPQMSTYSMARARIRCPLLSDDDACILYPYRPITCRVYGIPTMIQGVPRICGSTGFKKDQAYPIFNMDGVQKELFQLSKDLLKNVENDAVDERAPLLVSIPKIIKTTVEDLVNENPEGPGVES
ncbi:MAG: YkgJ family cysteine cluster protein [Deltaproteobacteria bacterium]|nr:YkgJ family cysteine cluster protein [Deltaproteobacteria bacterium]